MPRSFTEDGAAGAGDSGGGYNPNIPGGGGFQGGMGTSHIDDSGMTMAGTPPAPKKQSYGTWGGDAGAPMIGGGLNVTGNNGNTAPGTLNSAGKVIGSELSEADYMKFGAGGFGGPGAQLSGPPPGFMFAQGGEVEGADEQFGFDPMASQGDLVERLAAARATVKGAMDFGRKQNGLEQLAGLNRMPTVPASQSESGIPPERPFPRLEPTKNPFGKRAEGAIPDGNDDGADGPVGFNPSQSETGIPRPPPGPGTLPPAPVPFGKRRIGENSQETAPIEQVASAIPEEDTEETA